MIEVQAKEAIAAIKVLSLAPEQAGIPSSSFVRVSAKGGRLRLSLGGDLFATSEMRGKGQESAKLLFVGRWEFISFFQTISKKPFRIEISGSKLTIQQGRRKASLSGTAEGMGYPEQEKLPPSAREVKLRRRLLGALDVACTCSAGGPSTAYHCVFLRNEMLLASDQLLAFQDQLQKSIGKRSLMLPMAVIPLLKAEGTEKLIITESRVVLKFPNGMVFHPLPEQSVRFPEDQVSDLLCGNTYYVRGKEKERLFCKPDHKHHSILKEKWPEIFSIRVEKFEELLRQFSVYLNGAEKLRASVTVGVEKGSKEALFYASTQYAKFKEKVVLPELVKTKASIKLPVEFLLPFSRYWLERNPKRFVHAYCDKESPCLLVCGTSRLIVPSHALSELEDKERGGHKQ